MNPGSLFRRRFHHDGQERSVVLRGDKVAQSFTHNGRSTSRTPRSSYAESGPLEDALRFATLGSLLEDGRHEFPVSDGRMFHVAILNGKANVSRTSSGLNPRGGLFSREMLAEAFAWAVRNGRRQPGWDTAGDTVNTAAAAESAEPGELEQIRDALRQFNRDANQYAIDENWCATYDKFIERQPAILGLRSRRQKRFRLSVEVEATDADSARGLVVIAPRPGAQRSDVGVEEVDL